MRRPLTEKEKAQRARLEEMLKGRPRPVMRVEDFGAPHLDERDYPEKYEKEKP